LSNTLWYFPKFCMKKDFAKGVTRHPKSSPKGRERETGEFAAFGINGKKQRVPGVWLGWLGLLLRGGV